MQFQDDRTEEQRWTHTVLVGGRDRCMSGWGKARGGSSWAFWACEPDAADAVERWVKSRGDIERIGRDLPGRRSRGHCHTYVVTNDHPALYVRNALLIAAHATEPMP